MSLAEHDAIAPGVVAVFQAEVRLREIQHRQNFADGERAPRVSGLRRVQRVDDVATEPAAQTFEPVFLFSGQTQANFSFLLRV